MADIRSYLREKEKRNQQYEENYTDKIRKHRLTIFYRVALAVVLVAAVLLVVFLQYRDKVYAQMNQISTIERQAVAGAKDISLGSNLVTYSNDGISCMDSKGKAIWNQTYEMQNPMITTCQDVLAIADYNGRNIYLETYILYIYKTSKLP